MADADPVGGAGRRTSHLEIVAALLPERLRRTGWTRTVACGLSAPRAGEGAGPQYPRRLNRTSKALLSMIRQAAGFTPGPGTPGDGRAGPIPGPRSPAGKAPGAISRKDAISLQQVRDEPEAVQLAEGAAASTRSKSRLAALSWTCAGEPGRRDADHPRRASRSSCRRLALARAVPDENGASPLPRR